MCLQPVNDGKIKYQTWPSKCDTYKHLGINNSSQEVEHGQGHHPGIPKMWEMDKFCRYAKWQPRMLRKEDPGLSSKQSF